MTRKELQKKTVAELRAIASKRGLTGCSRLRKDELVAALAKAAKRAPVKKAGGRAKAASAPRRKPMKRAAPAPKRKPVKRAAPAPKRKPAKKAAPDRRRRSAAKSGPTAKRALSPRMVRSFSAAASGNDRPRRLAEQKIKASKYFLGVGKSPELDEGFRYPETYGENAIRLMVRDPYWLYSYWEFAPGLRDELAARLGEEVLSRCRMVLRVYDVTDTDPENAAGYHDIDVAPTARNWYINVMRVEREYCVDIGLVTPDGSFIVIARSNRVALPPVGPSDVVDEEWVTIEALSSHYEQTGGGPSSGSGGWGSGGWGS